ncbi:phage tail protein [Paraburkholderia tropica]|uniref:phage tail protein n=1 Tax=Paraburkholderia tropica TaxID=92647 RepID=UPI002ABE991C|nr:phage tail protein [Paraburkholderia tropica]
MNLDIKIDSKAIERQLDDLARKQIPFATAMAINDVSRHARTDLRDTMQSVFENPVPYTLNSVRLKLATKARPVATVAISDDPDKGIPPAKYLSPEILGGPRNHKRFERALQIKGIMPAGTYAVPGDGAPINGNGNIPGSFLVQLLSYFQAFSETGYRANMTQKRMAKLAKVGVSTRGYKKINGVVYFAANGRGKTVHLAPGIYAKSGTHGAIITPVILFVQSPTYKARFPFGAVVEESVEKNFDRFMRARLDQAIATAK